MSAAPYSEASEVVRQLGLACLLYMGGGRCVVPGDVPDWWTTFAGGHREEFAIDDRQPFLLNFLVDAEAFWRARHSGSLPSGVWEHAVGDDRTLLLEAHAVCRGQDSLLLIEDISSNSSNQTNVIRASRNVRLEMLRDIALRKQIEIELRNARDAAQQLEQAKTRLLANTSHELRTPIAGVIGMLELALESAAERNTHLETAYHTACRLERTLSALLDYASFEAQQPRLQLEYFSLTQVARDLASAFSLAAAEKGLRLELAFPAEQELILHSDRTRLEQIISNLVDNAIRYTADGCVKLSLRRADPEHGEIVVSDTGPGVSADEQQMIFQLFERGSSSHRVTGGKGLGLAIVQDLVRAVGGQISLESQQHRGSTFRVRLPLDLRPNAATQSGDQRSGGPEPPSAEPVVTELPAGLRILVAEDNQTNRAYLAHVLRSANCRVDEVDNGADMVRLALTHDYDIALTDCRMPKVSGLEAIRQIRQAEGAGGWRLPIIAITADPGNDSTQQFFEAGTDDILSKPVARDEILKTIARHLRTPDATA